MRWSIFALLASLVLCGTASAAVPKGVRQAILKSAHKTSVYTQPQLIRRRVSIKEIGPKKYEASINGTVKSTGARMTFKMGLFEGKVRDLKQTKAWIEEFNY